MIELYHGIKSVGAEKLPIVLEEKGQEVEERLMTLRGDPLASAT